jgi:hypothetical protein
VCQIALSCHRRSLVNAIDIVYTSQDLHRHVNVVPHARQGHLAGWQLAQNRCTPWLSSSLFCLDSRSVSGAHNMNVAGWFACG